MEDELRKEKNLKESLELEIDRMQGRERERERKISREVKEAPSISELRRACIR